MDSKSMNFKDRWEEDENGNRFLFTVEMQRGLSKAGLPVETDSLGDVPEPVPQPQERPPEPEEKPTPREEITEPVSIQIDPLTGKYIGRVKWYNARKGYGFILRGAGEEIFFHRTNTTGNPEDLDEGQWILYDVEETNKGPEATDIEPYSGESVE